MGENSMITSGSLTSQCARPFFLQAVQQAVQRHALNSEQASVLSQAVTCLAYSSAGAKVCPNRKYSCDSSELTSRCCQLYALLGPP